MPEELTRVNFTNLGKVLYPELGITKAQIIEYYIRIAPRMLGLLVNRPLSLTRFPDGVDKEGFYEKDVPRALRLGWRRSGDTQRQRSETSTT